MTGIKYDKKKIEFIQLTAIQKEIIASMQSICFLPGSFDKKFYNTLKNQIESRSEIYEKQWSFVKQLFHKYRRQIKNYSKLCIALNPDNYTVVSTSVNTLFGIETKSKVVKK